MLRLDSLPTAVLVGVCVVPLSTLGGQAGILQGERRWSPLAAIYVAAGVPRLVLGTAIILWRPNVTAALVGVAVAMFVPVILGWWRCATGAAPGPGPSTRRVRIRESVHNSQTLFAFFALSSVDIVIARNVLPDHQAGLYAAGLILTKAVLFLPQFVVIIAFPSMASVGERRTALIRSLVVVAGLGVFATAAAWLLPHLAMIFVGGAEYAEIEPRLWLFAMLGTLLSMLQLLVYSVLARQGQRSVYSVWLALVVMVVAGLQTSTLTGLLTVVLATDATLLVLLLAASLTILRRPAPVPEPVSS